MNINQAKKLASTSGWQTFDHTGSVDGWTLAFRKPGVAVIRVRFSENGMLTRLNAIDFVTGIRSNPTRDKGTRLSHYLTEGITHD